MKKTVMVLLAGMLAGCGGAGTPVIVKDAIDRYRVERLFTVEGVTVYRFHDFGHARYLGVQSDRVTTSGTAMQNKNGSTPDSLDTVYR